MNNQWRRKPLAQAVLCACCALMLTGGSGVAVAQIPYHNLGAGALPVAAQSGWLQSGVANGVVNGNHMLIQQQSQRAILHWHSFNIGRGNAVEFQQPSAGSVALRDRRARTARSTLRSAGIRRAAPRWRCSPRAARL